jgi:hypothetical protein
MTQTSQEIKKNAMDIQEISISAIRATERHFVSFVDCVSALKKSVYMIVRARKIKIGEKSGLKWITLGSGSVVAPYRFITAAHVLNEPSKGEFYEHREGDLYMLIKHDDEGKFSYRTFEPLMDKEIFLYPDLDLGVIYLDKDFYVHEGMELAKESDFISVSTDFLPIGSQIGVLGYPLCELQFKNGDVSQPLIGNVLMRTDTGVVNCRYRTHLDQFSYEFTLAFNPGNSGGPIFDVSTGKLVSIVKGYKSTRINIQEVELSNELKNQFKGYKQDSFIETLHANYSFGFATPSFSEVFKKHGII